MESLGCEGGQDVFTIQQGAQVRWQKYNESEAPIVFETVAKVLSHEEVMPDVGEGPNEKWAEANLYVPHVNTVLSW